MKNIQLKLFKDLILIKILFLVFICFLFNYCIETTRYKKSYGIHKHTKDIFLVNEEKIDISKSDAEFTYYLKHPLPESGYQIHIAVPKNKLVRNFDFQVKITLTANNRETFNKVFVWKRRYYCADTSGTWCDYIDKGTFQIYPSKRSNAPTLKLTMKIVKPGINEESVLATLSVIDIPATFPRQDFLLLIMVLITIFPLILVLPSTMDYKKSEKNKIQLIAISCMAAMVSLAIIEKYLFSSNFLPDSDNRMPFEFIHFVNLGVVIGDIGLLSLLIYLSAKNKLMWLIILISALIIITILLLGGHFLLYFLALFCGGA